jgi:hypothetical protein
MNEQRITVENEDNFKVKDSGSSQNPYHITILDIAKVFMDLINKYKREVNIGTLPVYFYTSNDMDNMTTEKIEYLPTLGMEKDGVVYSFDQCDEAGEEFEPNCVILNG